jgi:hypothetical protein
MQKITKKLTAILGLVLLMIGCVTIYSVSWLDRQTIPQINKFRGYLLFVAKIVPLTPFPDKEKYVVRTIKLASLLATSKVGEKSVEMLGEDLAYSYRLLSDLLNKKDLPDQAAYAEVALERLILSNRMQALAMLGGQRLSLDEAAHAVIDKMRFAYDQETNDVSMRELSLFRILTNQPYEEQREDVPRSLVSATDSLYIGLGKCATQNDRGAEEINNALRYFVLQPTKLAYLINRNVDYPLIVAAQNSVTAEKCNFSVNQLKKITRG